MIASPISGMYVYRSAIACSPTCTIPMTGTSVTTYHSHPKARYRRVRPSLRARSDTAASAASAIASEAAGTPSLG